MGTNYYLHRRPEPCPTCGRTDTSALHIGKSSFGWVFLWRGYREGQEAEQAIETPDAWLRYLRAQTKAGAVIKDEYGDKHSISDLVRLVHGKAKPRADGEPPRRHEPLSPRDTVSFGSSDVLFAEFS